MLKELIVLAGTEVETGVKTDLTNPLGADRFKTLGDIFGFVINLVIGVGYALVFVMVALGFVQYVMSRGDKTATQNAQQWLTYAIIGGVGLFFVTILKTVLEGLLGVEGSGINVGGGVSPFESATE